MINKKILINNIQFAYRNDDFPAITKEEVKNYIASVNFLENVLNFTKTAILIIEYKTWSYVYASSNTKEVIGYEAEEFLEGGPSFALSSLHPESLRVQQSIHPIMVQFFESIEPEEKGMYKFCFTARHTSKDGRELSLLQNNIFLKWDETGKPLVKLILYTDISCYQREPRSLFYITRIDKTGEPKIVLQKDFSSPAETKLSDRELEIIQLTATGLSAKQVAKKLVLSEETIKNHKKNIKSKLGCTNSAEMVALSRLYGLTGRNQNDPGV